MKKTLKTSVLFTVVLASLGYGVQAAPKSAVAKPAVKKPVEQWEYAFVDPNAHKPSAKQQGYVYGVEIRFNGRPPIFLERSDKQYDSKVESFLLDIFDRLGAQGWELISGPSYRESSRYIFKRRK